MEISSVLFAAGRGKRLRPLTDRIPKPALPVLDIPLAAWALAELTRHAAPVVVNASHLAAVLTSSLERLPFAGWEIFDEGAEALGTAGTLRALRDRLGPRVVTYNGDALIDLALPDLLRSHERTNAPATLVARPVPTHADLRLDGRAVAGFIDRRAEPGAAGARFLGVAVFERGVLARLPKVAPAGLGETLLRDLAERNELNVYLFDGYAADVGTPEALLEVSLDVLHKRAPQPPVPLPGRVVKVQGGLAYVGPGAEIDPSALGPGAIVLAGAKLRRGRRVENEIVWRDEERDHING